MGADPGASQALLRRGWARAYPARAGASLRSPPMSCEENRGRYLAAVCGPTSAGLARAAELERLFGRERGEPGDALEAADNEAKTRLLFAQFGRCDPPLRPPTHSADGLPKRDAQRGYARLYDWLGTLAGQGAV